MNWVKKLDNGWIGFLIGVLFPVVLFILYWLFTNHQISFPTRYVKYLLMGNILSNVIKMCGLGNLLMFYFGLHYRLDKFSKGIIFSVIVYVALIAYITYYHEVSI